MTVTFYSSITKYTNGEKSFTPKNHPTLRGLLKELGDYYGKGFESFINGNETCLILINGKGIKMRKLIVILSVLVVIGFTGCDNEPDTSDPSGGKVVAEQYRGIFYSSSFANAFELTANKLIFIYHFNPETGVGEYQNNRSYTAWTINNDVYYFQPGAPSYENDQWRVRFENENLCYYMGRAHIRYNPK